MSKLEKNLTEWVSTGLITSEQARRIREHEETKPESPWILTGLLVLGAVIIGIGVISLIASNWEEIPDWAKLAGDFSLLGGLAYLTAFSFACKRLVLFEVLLLFYLILCLASIGLISQIFHTGGELYEALLFWSLLTGAAAACSRRMFVPFFWAGLSMAGAIQAALSSQFLESIFRSFSRSNTPAQRDTFRQASL